MKITFEFNDNILEETKLEATLFFNEKLKQVVARTIKKELVDYFRDRQPDFGDLGITKDDIKKTVIDLMAQEQVEKLKD